MTPEQTALAIGATLVATLTIGLPVAVRYYVFGRAAR
jgi:hypothetical protein